MPADAIIKQNPKQRNSSLELLRIISMLMIVGCHFATHGGFSFDAKMLSIPRFWWYAIEMGGNFGVDVFVLISGYFLVKGDDKIFDLARVLRFWGQVIFYSILIYVVFGALGISDFNFKSLVKTIFPITFSSWWFASTYFVLYIIHPFINILINKLDKQKFQKLLIMLLVLWCIIPTFTSSSYQSNSLLWFVSLYCVAGYVRIFGLNNVFTSKRYLVFWIILSSLRYLSSVVLILIGTKISFVSNYALFFYGTQSILTFLSALALFMYFVKKDIGYHKWINFVATATFGVYLIHDNSIVRPFLWLTIFKNAQYQDSLVLIPYSVAVVCVVYVCCTLIDLGRKQFIEKPYMSLVNKYADCLQKPFESIIVFFKNIVFGKQ